MEIGNQIKALRLRRGISQDTLAQHFGITAQAVSKWERGVATPDISLLPELSAYFGVSIDELFALSDDTRMERIQNMLWDVRYLEDADVEASRTFLLNKGTLEPKNGRVYELLADMENHIAKEHHARAEEYAKEALARDPLLRGAHGELVYAMDGFVADWNLANHYALIDFYEQFLKENPTCKNGYLTIIDQLIDDYRLDEAVAYCETYATMDDSYRPRLYRGKIAWKAGDREEAFRIWSEMERDFPEEWCVYHNIADHMTRAGMYEEAERYYCKAIDVQKAPRYTDPFDALAQLYERMGHFDCAIKALHEELEVFDKEWNFTTGESADCVRREIARLEAKKQNG